MFLQNLIDVDPNVSLSLVQNFRKDQLTLCNLVILRYCLDVLPTVLSHVLRPVSELNMDDGMMD